MDTQLPNARIVCPMLLGLNRKLQEAMRQHQAGQREYLNDLVTRIQTVPNEKGNGFFYWNLYGITAMSLGQQLLE